MIGLQAKLERTPFDIPEAETEIVAGPWTELTGRRLAIMDLTIDVSFVVGSALVAAIFLGGPMIPWTVTPAWLEGVIGFFLFLAKTLAVLLILSSIKVATGRIRIRPAERYRLEVYRQRLYRAGRNRPRHELSLGVCMSVLREMFENLLSRPITILYPKEKVPIPGAFRGTVAITDEKCIGCSKCSLVCPAQAITMIEGQREVEFRGKTLARKKRPQVKLYKCIRCGLCERHCPTGAIYLKNELSSSGTDGEIVVT